MPVDDLRREMGIVRESLDRLLVRRTELIVLLYAEGFTLAEVASESGLTLGIVRRTIMAHEADTGERLIRPVGQYERRGRGNGRGKRPRQE